MLMIHSGMHFAHASYLALAEGAMSCGEQNIADTCRRMAEEEKSAAEWAETQLPAVVADVMNKKEEG